MTAFLFVGRAYPTARAPATMLALNFLLSAAVGAIVVRYLLASIVEVELSYGAILVALLAGSLASTVTQLVVFSPSRAGLATGFALSFVPGVVGALVSYWLLQNAANAELPAPTAPTAPSTPLEPGTRVRADPYAQVVSAARETALGLVAAVDRAEPSSAPSVISDGLLDLEAAAARLEQTPPPRDVPDELPRRLAAAMRQLAGELAETAQSAAGVATERMYQSGLLAPHLADVSDHGARYRWELDESESVREIKQTLAELDRLGYGSIPDSF